MQLQPLLTKNIVGVSLLTINDIHRGSNSIAQLNQPTTLGFFIVAADSLFKQN